MTKKIAVKINVLDDVSGGDVPDGAIITIDRAAAIRIRQLSRAVKELKILHAVEFDSTPDLYHGSIFEQEPVKVLTDDDETTLDVTSWDDTGTADCVCLEVGELGFFYSGMIKHTSIHWETQEINLEAIKGI